MRSQQMIDRYTSATLNSSAGRVLTNISEGAPQFPQDRRQSCSRPSLEGCASLSQLLQVTLIIEEYYIIVAFRFQAIVLIKILHMKSMLILALFVSGLLAVELEAGVPILLKEIKAIKTDNQEFKNLLDLELSQGTRLDEVVELVGDLLDTMKQDQLNDDLEYAHRTTALGLEIDWLRIVLGNLQRERSARNQQLQDTIAEIVQLGQILENIKLQLEVLNTKEEEVRQTRAQEAASYQSRTENNNRVLAALNEIIPKLTAAVFKEQGKVLLETEKFEIVEKLKRELGYNHPIAALVAITAKFDVPTVTRIIEKLEYIRDAVIALQQQEDERETVAIQTFQTAVQQFNELREKFSKDFEQVTQKLKKSENARVLLEKRIAAINKDLTITEKLLEETIAYKEQYDAAYAVRKAKRIGEIKTVQQAYDLVERHAKSKRQ